MEPSSKQEKIYVFGCFSLVCLILMFVMINNFKLIDFCYFLLVLVFAIKYMLLCRE